MMVLVLMRMVRVFERWCAQPKVCSAIDALLLQAVAMIKSPVRYVLQVQGVPLAHDPALSFVHLYLELPESAQAYTVVACPDAMPFCAGVFDVVVSFFPHETLEDEYEPWAKEVSRVLRSDGWLVVFGVNPLSFEAWYSWLGVGSLPFSKIALNPFRMHDKLVRQGFVHRSRCYAGLAAYEGESIKRPYFSLQHRQKEDGFVSQDWSEGVMMMDVYQMSSEECIHAVAVA